MKLFGSNGTKFESFNFNNDDKHLLHVGGKELQIKYNYGMDHGWILGGCRRDKGVFCGEW